METKNIKVYCVNDGLVHEVAMGASLDELARIVFPVNAAATADDPDSAETAGQDRNAANLTPAENADEMPYAKLAGIGCGYTPTLIGNLPVLACLVDNRLKQLDFTILTPVKVEFITYAHPDGRRTYINSLSFVLQEAVRELFPGYTFIIDYNLPSGLYCELRKTAQRLPDGRSGGIAMNDENQPIVLKLSDRDLRSIRSKAQDIIGRNLQFSKAKIPAKAAIDIFEANDQPQKARLIKSLGKYTVNVCTMIDENGNVVTDNFYGPVAMSTGCLGNFAISGFKDGFVMQYPMEGDTSKIAPMVKQSKIASILKMHSNWCFNMGITGIGTLNSAILAGKAIQIINLSETWHEKEYSEIADKIYQQRKKVKIVFIAGPSSSGKTSSSLRLALHCKNWGLNPKVIELDNYFVDREHTPKDENGEYDFEALEAMDLKLLNEQLNDLLAGKEVEIPHFNFKNGCRDPKGNPLKLAEKDILIMEGIHSLNPAMTPNVDNDRVFRVYASTLTSLSIDENNNISTSDNRLLRRMVRDNRVRGITPEETILRWHSVRRGENRNIFPFQENADAAFNSALIFELPLLKYYAEPLLRRIDPASPAYTEAVRLLKFLDYIIPLSPDEIAAIPPTSIIREFFGGQTL